MEHTHFCQSCHNPIDNPKFMGTEIDGSRNHDYCIYCYRHGSFTNPDLTLDEMKAQVRKQLRQMNEDPAAIEKVVNGLSQLKRWTSEVPVM